MTEAAAAGSAPHLVQIPKVRGVAPFEQLPMTAFQADAAVFWAHCQRVRVRAVARAGCRAEQLQAPLVNADRLVGSSNRRGQ